jgi:hypothetical protein
MEQNNKNFVMTFGIGEPQFKTFHEIVGLLLIDEFLAICTTSVGCTEPRMRNLENTRVKRGFNVTSKLAGIHVCWFFERKSLIN